MAKYNTKITTLIIITTIIKNGGAGLIRSPFSYTEK